MIFVDANKYYPGKGTWCHMWANDLEELHSFAIKIGLRRAWFQGKNAFMHYDLVPSKRLLAIRNGAVEKPLKMHLREQATIVL